MPGRGEDFSLCNYLDNGTCTKQQMQVVMMAFARKTFFRSSGDTPALGSDGMVGHRVIMRTMALVPNDDNAAL